jgi:hypothetical protein
MTQAGETEATEDRGFPFFVVRMVVPSSTAMESLAPDQRDRVQANIERARRLFRSRTLPCPESDARLSASWFDIFSLSSKVDATILEGIQHEAALAILALPPSSSEDKVSMRIEIAETGTEGHRRCEIRSTSTLLGKYWYRHQEMNIFDSVKLVEELKAARERGESDLAHLFKPKLPAPPRRLK